MVLALIGEGWAPPCALRDISSGRVRGFYPFVHNTVSELQIFPAELALSITKLACLRISGAP